MAHGSRSMAFACNIPQSDLNTCPINCYVASRDESGNFVHRIEHYAKFISSAWRYIQMFACPCNIRIFNLQIPTRITFSVVYVPPTLVTKWFQIYITAILLNKSN
jgi:hypothetical protein